MGPIPDQGYGFGQLADFVREWPCAFLSEKSSLPALIDFYVEAAFTGCQYKTSAMEWRFAP